MKSISYRVDDEYYEYYAEAMEAGMVRPEPLVSDRIAAAGMVQTDFGRAANASIRAELAAAFRRLGRGRRAHDAYEQTRDFYRSSGQAWTRGLSR